MPLEETAAVRVPADAGQLHVEARLLYRKIDQYLLNYLMGPEAGVTAPVTEISSASGAIAIAGPPAPGI